MDSLIPQQEAYETQRAQADRAELAARIARVIRDDGRVEPLKGLYLARSSSRRGPVYGVSEPSFCMIAQGSKEVFLGEDRYQYDPAHYLLTTVELPTISQILEASKEQPYLSIRLHLDAASAGSRVGYDDAAHFNREYKSLFGLPPMRDVERLREAAGMSTLQEVARGS